MATAPTADDAPTRRPAHVDDRPSDSSAYGTVHESSGWAPAIRQNAAIGNQTNPFRQAVRAALQQLVRLAPVAR